MPDQAEQRTQREQPARAPEAEKRPEAEEGGTGMQPEHRDESGKILGRPVEDRSFEVVETGAAVAAGAGVGAAAGGPIGAAVGGVVGAALGAVAGEVVEKAAGPAAETMHAGPLPEHDEAEDEADGGEQHVREGDPGDTEDGGS